MTVNRKKQRFELCAHENTVAGQVKLNYNLMHYKISPIESIKYLSLLISKQKQRGQRDFSQIEIYHKQSKSVPGHKNVVY